MEGGKEGVKGKLEESVEGRKRAREKGEIKIVKRGITEK